MASALLLCMGVETLVAQQVLLSPKAEKIYGSYLKPGSVQGWIAFNKDVPYNGENIFRLAPDLIGLGQQDEMVLFKTNTDAVGNKHYKYLQYYNGVRVEGEEYFAHMRNNALSLINGNVVTNLNIDVIPAISAAQSIVTVLNAFPAEKYLWEDDDAEQLFKLKKKDQNASLFPKPELLLVKTDPKGGNFAANYTLAYRMYLFAKIPYIAKYVYVDAKTGSILRSKNLDVTCNASSINTTFNGTQTVYTDYRTEECGSTYDDVTDYFSIDDCIGGTEIRSYFSGYYDTGNYGDDWLLCDGDNNWTGVGSEKMVLTTLWSTRKATNYFINVFGHESFDGTDGLIDVFSNKTYFDDDDNPTCRNANFTPVLDNLYFGSGNDCTAGTTDDYNTLDIVGHEFTHGIINYAHFDALDYEDESGALNESFADIFGELVEFYTEAPDTLSWLMAEDRGAIRSFNDPKSMGDPDTYLGTNWAPLGGDDNGGVHTNSSVQNYMFYLLVEGGSGTNDHGIEYNVEGIGYSHAKEIAWSAMMNYLNAADGYITARNAWIQAAIDLYGSCSQEVISVGQAWQAAGVTKYTIFDIASVCGTYVLTGYAEATYGIENKSILFGDFIAPCATSIVPGASVTFESAYYVNLNPGFEALSGCTFTAWIDPCAVSDYDPDDVRYAENNEGNDFQVSNKSQSLTIYPVPAATVVTLDIDVTSNCIADLHVTDLSGRLITTWMQSELIIAGLQHFNYDIQDLPSGIYFAVFKTDKGNQAAKFVVQH